MTFSQLSRYGLGVARDSWGFKPSQRYTVQLVRSLAVSVISLIFDFSTLVACKELVGINYLVAAAIGFIVGVIVNYLLSIVWVFPDHKLSSRHAEFVIFVIICAIGLGLNLAIIAGMVQGLSVDYRLAKLVSTIVVFFWNFFARKKILY